GAGGFINISQNAKRVVFVGTFSAGAQDIRIEDGHLRIVQDGALRKFVGEVEHRTFAGRLAAERGQPVLYVTERCVFALTLDGLELIEIAPGVDLERDILARMDFAPVVRQPKLMDPRLFRAERLGLRETL
ncbi:acyl CoA:acetate/3-ketoacid CoA transferase, partial [Pseudomonas sp. CrR25]|nr:acyl CoA:acetate/3-ketoacid CoA transferase [Pseudomonas sp. CrR25]